MPIFQHFRQYAMRSCMAAVAGAALLQASPSLAAGAGDLLVAPTRVVMNGAGSSESYSQQYRGNTATYRISLELRRMDAEGDLIEIPRPKPTAPRRRLWRWCAIRRGALRLHPTSRRRCASSHAPRRNCRREYRVHMLFRGVPQPTEVTPAAAAAPQGLAIQLIPIYGITIR